MTVDHRCRIPWSVLRIPGLAVLLSACGSDYQPPIITTPPPAELAAGAELYESHCSSCHGIRAIGTEVGPPLLHPVYRSSHHSDMSFQIAVTRGVAAHHWRYGDMPALSQLDTAQVARITAYVRWLQQEAGIQ